MKKSAVIFLIAVIILAAGIIFYTYNPFVEQGEENMANITALKITSPAFADNAEIPAKYTADGDNVNPEIDIEGIPSEAKSLVLIVDDPDAPAGVWVHWVVFNIPSNITAIKENSVPGEEGMNDFKQTSYGGPSPPPGKPHRYFFKVYALDTELSLGFATKTDVELAMKNHILAKGELVGKYGR